MSRTDKDAPHWARCEFYEPVHDWSCPDRVQRSWQKYPKSSHACTLPAVPVRINFTWPRYPRKIPDVPQCFWTPTWRYRDDYHYSPNAKDRRAYWWGPDRANVRNVLAKARQQYNGSGDVDVDEPVIHHRHAMYSGGWWD